MIFSILYSWRSLCILNKRYTLSPSDNGKLKQKGCFPLSFTSLPSQKHIKHFEKEKHKLWREPPLDSSNVTPRLTEQRMCCFAQCGIRCFTKLRVQPPFLIPTPPPLLHTYILSASLSPLTCSPCSLLGSAARRGNKLLPYVLPGYQLLCIYLTRRLKHRYFANLAQTPQPPTSQVGFTLLATLSTAWATLT